MKNTKKITMIVALVGAFAVAGTAHASLYGWSTCIHGEFGKTQARGHIYCSQTGALLHKFSSHLHAMQLRGDTIYAGYIDEFHPYAVGRRWDCFYKVAHYSSQWYCFGPAGGPLAEFRYLATVGADTPSHPHGRIDTTPAPPPPPPTTPSIACGPVTHSASLRCWHPGDTP
jgi:hypothetical protein